MSKASEKDSELGTLIVVLLKAKNLNDNHSFRKQDVLAQATLNGVQKRSHVDIRGGQHPEWDSEIRFTVLKGNGPGGKNRKLEVACYAQEPKREYLLGKATVDISDTLKTGEFDDWVSLDVDGVVRGDIYLEMTFYANASTLAAASNNKLLVPVQGTALGRRPSKLSPSNRLSRPIQLNAAGLSTFSPKQHSRLHDLSNPTSSRPINNVSPIIKKGSLPALLADETVHATDALSNTLELRSRSPPQAITSQLAVLPPILRPGLGHSSSIPTSNPGQRQPNRVPSESSISSNNGLHGTTPDVSQLPPNPYIGGSGAHTSAYTPGHSGLSNINGSSSSNPYIGGSGVYTAGEQHQQAPGGRTYSPTLPGAWPDGRPYSHVQTFGPSNLDGIVSLNPYTGGSAFMPGGQHQQASGGRSNSPVPLTLSVQVSGPSHPSVPISASPLTLNPYVGNGKVYLPGNQLGPNALSYSPALPSVSLQASGSSDIGHSATTDPHTGASGALIPGHQQAPQLGPNVPTYSPAPPPVYVQASGSSNIEHSALTDSYTRESGVFIPGPRDGRAYSVAPPINTTQTLGQAPTNPSPSYNASVGIDSSGPLAFPMPVKLSHEPSSHMRPGLGGQSGSSYYQPPLPPRTDSVSNNRSKHEELPDSFHLARYRTPFPLPRGSVNESPPPPPVPPMTTPTLVSSAVGSAPVFDPTRVEALRKIEQDVARRREQELKDMELAMQLDRELNL